MMAGEQCGGFVRTPNIHSHNHPEQRKMTQRKRKTRQKQRN